MRRRPAAGGSLMSWYVRVALCLAVATLCVAAAPPKPHGKAKARVEFRWVETSRVKGLTEDKGFQSSCAPNDLVYPHKKPALVVTAAEVAEVRFTGHKFGEMEHFMVDVQLTRKARERLAATVEGKQMRLLTVVI